MTTKTIDRAAAAAGLITGRPVRYRSVSGVGEWLGVTGDLVLKWVNRYAGGDHPTPPHDIEVVPGRGGPASYARGWADTPERKAEWVAWEAGRTGQGRPGVPKPRHTHHEPGPPG